METEQKPRFKKGELVLYMGSVLRVQGWLFRVTWVSSNADAEARYDLFDDASKLRVLRVRESSLRGPHDE